ncbi:MAG: DinB family protein [Saprospiraceae bacterium]
MYPNTITTTIPEFIEDTLSTLSTYSDHEWEEKPEPDKWSRKEILGHLVDSAMTNIRRLIVSQNHQNEKITYQQNEWVRFSDYQHMDIQDLMTLWKLINLQYHKISKTIPAKSLSYTTDTDSETVSLKTLSYLIEDYWGHQQHHLGQIYKDL